MAAVGAAGGLPAVAPVVAAVAANVAGNAVVVLAWRDVLAAAGARLPARVAAWVWSLSQLARYTLGAAQVGGRALVGRRWGLTATAGAVTALVEVAWQSSLTATLVLATLPWWLTGAEPLRGLAAVGVLPAALLVAGLVDPQGMLRAVARVLGWAPLRRLGGVRLAAAAARVRMGRAQAARLTLLYAGNAALRLAAFLLLFAAVGGHLAADGLRAAGAYGLGQLVGRLAVFAPGGLGPREGATALAIFPAIGGGPALVLVAAVRLAEIVAEALFFAAARVARPPAQQV